MIVYLKMLFLICFGGELQHDHYTLLGVRLVAILKSLAHPIDCDSSQPDRMHMGQYGSNRTHLSHQHEGIEI